MKYFTTILIIIISTIFSPCWSQNNYLIKNINVIPLHINQVLNQMDVFIEDGRLVKITKHRSAGYPNDSTSVVIDGTDKYLVPAYVDAHVHLPDSLDFETFMWMQLLNGVTTFRSMRGKEWHLQLWERLQKEAVYSKLILASPPVSRRDTLEPTAISSRVRSWKAKGYDCIKVLSVKDLETFNHLAEAAKENQLPLAGHCPSNVGILNVAQSDIFQSIEHLGGVIRLSDIKDINNGIETAIRHNLYHCPTMDWYYTSQLQEEELRKRVGHEFLSKAIVEGWEAKITSYHDKTTAEERKADKEKQAKRFNARLNYLGYLYRQGGQLIMSPDASGLYGIPGFAYHDEMQHFSKAGISNFDILKASSYNFAKMLGQDDQWGTIKVGQHTDLLILSDNPLENISAADQVDAVVINGHYLSQKQIVENLKSSVANRLEK